ncbi:hypothetical protein KY285_029112 [Solanum tuberosum]|nr:hypothetical protein KY285_029112 [Solanum tuberosum]
MSYPSTKKDKDDWLAVLKVNPRDAIELPDEGVITILEPNLPFQVEEVEVHEIDMNIIVDETILLHDPNGEAIEMDEPIDYGLFPEHHELDEEFTEDEYETENESEEDDEEVEPSSTCSNRICESFKSELDPKGTNWKSVPQETKDFYLRESEKEFYWDPSIDSQVKIQWRRKATRRYNDFISGLKKEGKRPKYISEEIWESWMSIWKKPEVIEKSKINSRNRCGGQNAVAKGTHTGGSIKIGEDRKRLAIKNGRDPTPSKIHLHVHTHGHDGKSYVGERARIVHSWSTVHYISSYC